MYNVSFRWKIKPVRFCFYLHIVHVCIVSMQLLLYKTDPSLIHNVWMDVTDGLWLNSRAARSSSEQKNKTVGLITFHFNPKSIWLKKVHILCFALCCTCLKAGHLYTHVWLIVIWLHSWTELALSCLLNCEIFFTAGVGYEFCLQMNQNRIWG